MDQNEEFIQTPRELEVNEAVCDEMAEGNGSSKHSTDESEGDGEDSEEDSTTEEESVEEEEPKLKYKRLDASELLKTDSASAMSVSDRIVVCISKILINGYQ